jgi:hypothetical protein
VVLLIASTLSSPVCSATRLEETTALNFGSCVFNGLVNPANGGAISITGASLELAQCGFVGCQATNTLNGGAIWVSGGANHHWDRCCFSSCSAQGNAGAVHLTVDPVQISSFRENNFYADTVWNTAGAVYSMSGMKLSISNFTQCTCGWRPSAMAWNRGGHLGHDDSYV